MTVGVLRASVILPAGWLNWHSSTKRAVLAHEFAHIRRGDTWISFLTRLAKCLYWFHPLAWWISRQIADLAELSCDAVVLEKNGDPGGYSRILLGFAESVNTAGYRAALPGLAIASRSGMSHRIDQVFELAGGNLRKLSRPGTMLAFMGVPVMCIAAVVGLTAPASRVLLQAAATVTPSQPVLVAQQPACRPQPAKPLRRDPRRPKPKFDAASIKPCAPGTPVMGRGGAGPAGTRAQWIGWILQNANLPGRLSISCGSIMSMVNISYVLNGDITLTNSPKSPGNSDQHVKGVPDWAMSARYTIEAETDNPIANDVRLTRTEQPGDRLMEPMLQVASGRPLSSENSPGYRTDSHVQPGRGEGRSQAEADGGGCSAPDPETGSGRAREGSSSGEWSPDGKTMPCMIVLHTDRAGLGDRCRVGRSAWQSHWDAGQGPGPPCHRQDRPDHGCRTRSIWNMRTTEHALRKPSAGPMTERIDPN